jgi:multidrug efflux pump subunit AcrB
MKLVLLALSRPISVLVGVVALILFGGFMLRQIQFDIFPQLNQPVIYVCQPYAGMDPKQMEGYLTNYYEYHFLYITGIHHVESKNIQGLALMKLTFHPGTNMSQAMAETINYVGRAQAFMPPGTVSPFVMRYDTDSVPVGRLVLSSETRKISEVQDLALFRVRPVFAALPGVSAPPPFGGSQRTVVVTADPERMKAYNLSAEDIAQAIANSNKISPSGNLVAANRFPMVPVNSVVRDVKELGNIALLRQDNGATVFLRDVVKRQEGRGIEDYMDLPTGYALVNGRKAVYIPVTKRSDASTLDVVNRVKEAIPEMQDKLPPDVKVSFEFDQSPFVTRALWSVGTEGTLGAILVGLMVLLFLRDWRSTLVVILNIPLALLASVVGLYLTGHTINVMTLGGLALAIGILVDEATVEIENIHTHMEHGETAPVAVLRGAAETNTARFLAMICILAVFISTFFMQGAAYALFVPLSLAVGFSMIASYILSSTLVPVLSVWLLRTPAPAVDRPEGNGHFGRLGRFLRWLNFDRFRRGYEHLLSHILPYRVPLVIAYFVLCVLVVVGVGSVLGQDIFPRTEAGQFRLRLRAPDGTHIGRTEEITQHVLDVINEEVGEENIKLTLGYVGTVPNSYPINAVYHWSGGPEEATVWVELKPHSGVDIEHLQEHLRHVLTEQMPLVRFSFEPAGISDEVMSFGAHTPIEIAISGPSMKDNRDFAAIVRGELETIPALRDLQYGQSLDYPTYNVEVDRQKAGLIGVTPTDVSRSLVAATSSTRLTIPTFWADPKTGVGYRVQVEVPRPVLREEDPTSGAIRSTKDLAVLAVKTVDGTPVRIQDVAEIKRGTMPGQYDRYNMMREVTLTANIEGSDLGHVASRVAEALTRAGQPPRGVAVEVRGQIPPMQGVLTGLGRGLIWSVVFIFLLLAANFQSLRLALAAITTAPAALAGVVLALLVTGTTLNIQSFIGAIMAMGVSMANAILLVNFAEHRRQEGAAATEAARLGASRRLRAILMTTLAMICGTMPMALALGETGEQNAPLGRALIGGLALATMSTLLVLPSIFALLQGRATRKSASLNPTDPHSAHYSPAVGQAGVL